MMMTNEIVEECWTLTGRVFGSFWIARYDRYTSGQPSTVTFDHEHVWKIRSRFLGGIHTHPHWVAYPSVTDDRTNRAWTNALGKPILCCIIGTDKTRAFWYMDDESEPIEVPFIQIGKYIIGKFPKVKASNEKPIHPRRILPRV